MSWLLTLWNYRKLILNGCVALCFCVLVIAYENKSSQVDELKAQIVAENIRVEMMRHESERLAARMLIQSQRSDRAQVNIERQIRNAEDDKISPALAAALDGLRSYGAEVSEPKP